MRVNVVLLKNGIMMLKYISLVMLGHIEIYFMIAGLMGERTEKSCPFKFLNAIEDMQEIEEELSKLHAIKNLVK